MATKVYWKGLRLVAGKTKRYIDKWYVQLTDNLDEEQIEAVANVRSAIDSMLTLLPVDVPTE